MKNKVQPKLILSRTAQNLQRSVMRDLMSLAVQPDIISFAGGLPASECLPVQAFKQSIEKVLLEDGSRALQYGPPDKSLREWIAGYMADKGVRCSVENIAITNGAQQSLAILSRLFADPGESAVIEEATFTGIQQVTVGRRLNVMTVPTNLDSGVDVDAVEACFRKSPRPKFAIIIPDFHNPLGVTISVQKRKRLCDIAASCNIPIIEDDPYSPLRFEGEPVPALKALDRHNKIIYIGSFSKMLAPGIRLGWIVAPEDIIDRITVLRESLDLESSQLMQRAVADFLCMGNLTASLHKLNETNRRRKVELLDALEAHFAPMGAHWTTPEGGLFVWVTLNEKIDTWTLFKKAIEKKVAFIPGTSFAVNGGFQNTLRLNFSNVRDGMLEEGIRRLASIVKLKAGA